MTGHHPSVPTASTPSRAAPLAVTIDGGRLFACWVESLGDRTRWVFVGADRVRHNGPAYRGEESLAAIKRLIGEWADQQALKDPGAESSAAMSDQ